MPRWGTRVIIVGCGIAGPILAINLLGQGYVPVVYERLGWLTEAGISLCLQPKALYVLATITGLRFEGGDIERLLFQSILPEDPGLLGESDLPKKLLQEQGFGLVGVDRTDFHRRLCEVCEDRGIQVVWGHKLKDIVQEEETVSVVFQNGRTDVGSFLIGCDGVHSATRTSTFGEEQVNYTGLVQVAGISPTPPGKLFECGTLLKVFGNGEQFTAYPVNETHSAWAATTRAPETPESWKWLTKEVMEQCKNDLYCASWTGGVGDLVRSSERMVQYGLYDRPQLDTWHQGRVVLIGDAAHPTTPHFGESASQAIEDVITLCELLHKYDAHSDLPPKESLEKAFTEYEQTRLPRITSIVEDTLKEREVAVVSGVEACKKRNAVYREIQKDEEILARRYAGVFSYNKPEQTA